MMLAEAWRSRKLEWKMCGFWVPLPSCSPNVLAEKGEVECSCLALLLARPPTCPSGQIIEGDLVRLPRDQPQTIHDTYDTERVKRQMSSGGQSRELAKLLPIGSLIFALCWTRKRNEGLAKGGDAKIYCKLIHPSTFPCQQDVHLFISDSHLYLLPL